MAVFIRRIATWLEQQRQKEKQLFEETRRRIEAETIWSTVGKTVISTQDLDQVLSTVIQVVNEKLQVETGSVLLRRPQTDELVFAKILRGNLEQFSSVHLRVGQGIVGWVVATGQSALVPDAAHDPRWYSDVDRKTGFTTRSILCVPLIAKGEVIGAIELLNKQGGTFTPDDLRLVESIAAPVAIAIQNARLHQQLRQQLDEVTQLFERVEHAKKEWEQTVDAIDEGIMLADPQGNILRANRTLANWLHKTATELVGQNCCRVVHRTDSPPPDCPHMQGMAFQDQARDVEIEEPHLGGIFRCISYPLRQRDGTFIGTVTVLKNVTTEKRLQSQLIQTEKLAATGRLAASLAHEINNPLQAIQGCLDLAQANPGNAEKQQRYLTLAKSELARLTTIVRLMLDLHRPVKEKRAPVDIYQAHAEIFSWLCKKPYNYEGCVRRM
jgi:GAF domain-containing protein